MYINLKIRENIRRREKKGEETTHSNSTQRERDPSQWCKVLYQKKEASKEESKMKVCCERREVKRRNKEKSQNKKKM